MTLTVEVAQGSLTAQSGAAVTSLAGWRTDSAARHRWELTDNQGWYDLILTSPNAPKFQRRLAGRLESGKPSITDPNRGV